MELGRFRLILSFALLGFLVGVAAYIIVDLFTLSSIIGLSQNFLLQIASAPWFLSGIGGAVLSVVIIAAFVHFTADN